MSSTSASKENGPDRSDWAHVEQALSRKTSRERRLRLAEELLHKIRVDIREHDFQFRKLLDQGELVAPEEAATYGDGLRNVEWHLETEIERLTTLLGSDNRMGDDREVADSSVYPSPSLSDPAPMSPDDLLSISEVARVLGISTSKAYKMSAKKELPIIKIGERALVRRGELQEWLKGRSTVSRRKRGR